MQNPKLPPSLLVPLRETPIYEAAASVGCTALLQFEGFHGYCCRVLDHFIGDFVGDAGGVGQRFIGRSDVRAAERELKGERRQPNAPLPPSLAPPPLPCPLTLLSAWLLISVEPAAS